MSQWPGGPGQPGFQYPMQTGFPGQQQQFAQQPQQFGQPRQQQFGQPQQYGGGGGFLASQPTGFAPGGMLRAQPTGFMPQQTGFAPQPTGFGGAGRGMPPVPPVPQQFQQQQSQFRAPPPPPPMPQSQFQTGAPSFLSAQPTGFPPGGRLLSQPTGMSPLMPQATGIMDPRLMLMQNTFLPNAPNFAGGMPAGGQSLQQSFNQTNQERGKPRMSWALTKAEKKNYDQIFRAWDQQGSGFISGQVALEVFGQSGLEKNDLARIWCVFLHVASCL